MDISVLLQIITVVISMLTLVITYFFDAILNRKSRTVSGIANERMQRLTKLREACGLVWAMTKPEYITTQKKCNKNVSPDDNQTYCYAINKAKYTLKTQTFPYFAQEKHLQETLDGVVDLAISYYNKPTKTIEKQLIEKREEFFTEASLYNWAMWKFIVKQADGKKHIGSEFDKVYDEILVKVKNFDDFFEEEKKQDIENIFDVRKKEKEDDK